MLALLPSAPQEISGRWYVALHTAECLGVEPYLHSVGELVGRAGHVPVGSEMERVELQIDGPVVELLEAEPRCRMRRLLRRDQLRKPGQEKIGTHEQICDAVGSPGGVAQDGLRDNWGASAERIYGRARLAYRSCILPRLGDSDDRSAFLEQAHDASLEGQPLLENKTPKVSAWIVVRTTVIADE